MILPGISDIIHNQYRVSLGICNRSDCQGDHPLEVSTQHINTDSEKLKQIYIRDAFKKKNYVDREIVPIPSYPPTIEAVSEYLDREYWYIFIAP